MSTIQHIQNRNYFNREILPTYATSNDSGNRNNSYQNNFKRKKDTQYQKRCSEKKTGTLLDIIA